MHKQLRSRAGERGNAMVISLLILLVLTGVGMGFVLQTKTETQIAGNGLRWSQALYNADAGAAEGLARMADAADSANYVGEAAGTVSPGWGVYIVDQNGASAEDPDLAAQLADTLDNDLDGLVDEPNERFPEVMSLQGGDAIPYAWVRVQYVLDDAGSVIRYGDHDADVTTPLAFNTVAGAPMIRITSQGERGNALRRVEIEAVKSVVNIPRAAIYAEDDQFKFNGTQFHISGVDYDPVTGVPLPANDEVPGIITTEDPDAIAGELQSNQVDNVDGQGAEPSVDDSPIDLDLQAMFNQYAPLADFALPAGTYSNVVWGGLDDYQITRIDGDLHGSGSVVGGGILLIDGNFTCTGQFLWYGLVIVLGDIAFSGGGAGIHIYGSVLLQGNIDQQVVGGNADILYSSEALDRLNNLGTYQQVSWLEL